MINIAKAIELLAPFHNAVIFSKVKSENSNRFNGQLTTGNLNYPFIGINDSFVTNEDLFEALEYHTSSQPNPTTNQNHTGVPIDISVIEWLNYQMI